MPRERYVPEDNQWLVYERFDQRAFAEAVWADVGQRFPITIESNGHVIVDFDDLPVGVSENGVKQAIRDNHPHR